MAARLQVVLQTAGREFPGRRNAQRDGAERERPAAEPQQQRLDANADDVADHLPAVLHPAVARRHRGTAQSGPGHVPSLMSGFVGSEMIGLGVCLRYLHVKRMENNLKDSCLSIY